MPPTQLQYSLPKMRNELAVVALLATVAFAHRGGGRFDRINAGAADCQCQGNVQQFILRNVYLAAPYATCVQAIQVPALTPSTADATCVLCACSLRMKSSHLIENFQMSERRRPAHRPSASVFHARQSCAKGLLHARTSSGSGQWHLWVRLLCDV